MDFRNSLFWHTCRETLPVLHLSSIISDLVSVWKKIGYIPEL